MRGPADFTVFFETGPGEDQIFVLNIFDDVRFHMT